MNILIDDMRVRDQVSCDLEGHVANGDLPAPDRIVCVSDNGSGRQRIDLVIRNIYKLARAR